METKGDGKMEPRVSSLLEHIRGISLAVCGEDLVGLYVHGSLALGGFCWEHSDIDWLMVSRTAPSQRQKEELMQQLLALEPDAPPKGLEMSWLLEEDCRRVPHPMPFVLHYSPMHRQRCLEDLPAYCAGMNGTDRDLAAHITVVRTACLTLWGPPPERVFAPVPREAYWDSICGDVEDAREGLLPAPVDGVLNLCRVLAYLREGKVLSKEQGARWAQTALPPEDACLVQQAWQRHASHQADACRWEDPALEAFARRMWDRIQESQTGGTEK